MIVLKRAKTATGLASCVFAGLALTASPSAADGFYVQAWGGVSVQRDQFSGGATAGGDPRAVDIDFDPGLAVGGGIGYAFDNFSFGRFRVEAELSYRENDVDSGSFNGGDQIFGGDNSSLAGMAVFYIDWTNLSERVVPYVGAGIGVAGVESDVIYAPAGGSLDSPAIEFGGPTDTELAYQFIAGFSVPLRGGLSLTLDGRYYATTDPDFERILVATDTVDSVLNSEFEAWHVTAGFRYAF